MYDEQLFTVRFSHWDSSLLRKQGCIVYMGPGRGIIPLGHSSVSPRFRNFLRTSVLKRDRIKQSSALELRVRHSFEETFDKWICIGNTQLFRENQIEDIENADISA